MKKITIVSLGWLGLDVFKKFSSDYECSGSYNKSSKKVPLEYKFDINTDLDFPLALQEADILFFNLPPSKIENYVNLEKLFKLYKDKEVILISSTSVYENLPKADEDSKLEANSKRALRQLKVESILTDNVKNHTILRCAGLYDEVRHPGFYLSGKKEITGANTRVNLVSKKDILDSIEKVLGQKRKGIINLVNINHPNKKEYYSQFCKKKGIEKPVFSKVNLVDRVVETKFKEFLIGSNLP